MATLYNDEFIFDHFKYIRITNEKGEIIGCRKTNIITFMEEKIDYIEYETMKLEKNKTLKKVSLVKSKPFHI